MNPFDFYGPQFLLFFITLSIATLLAAYFLRVRLETSLTAGPSPVLHDPYAIAYLRGGKFELLRVAVISLVDRGLLHAANKKVATTELGQQTDARKRIEKDLLRYCVAVRTPEELFQAVELETGVAEYAYVLEQHKLVADDDVTRMRTRIFGGAAAFLVLIALVKIVIALSRGRTNIIFLILLAAVAVFVARKVVFPLKTVRGERFLAELQNLFQSLRLRAPQIRPGGANADLVLATAVFGVDVLSRNEFAWAYDFQARAASSGSSGSSCGSSCGGGGCGGGCGGCGG